MSEKKGSNARKLLVLKWTLVGFFLAISYKSVLRALLMKVEYENKIDTIDEMLESQRTLMVLDDTSIKHLMQTDPREKIKMMAKDAQFYKFYKKNSTKKISQEWVIEGYFLCIHLNFSKPNIFLLITGSLVLNMSFQHLRWHNIKRNMENYMQVKRNYGFYPKHS